MIEQSDLKLNDILNQNSNQLTMLMEDRDATTALRCSLVQQREDLEALIDSQRYSSVCRSVHTASDDLGKAFLTDLVAELQQYLMDKITGQSSD